MDGFCDMCGVKITLWCTHSIKAASSTSVKYYPQFHSHCPFATRREGSSWCCIFVGIMIKSASKVHKSRKTDCKEERSCVLYQAGSTGRCILHQWWQIHKNRSCGCIASGTENTVSTEIVISASFGTGRVPVLLLWTLKSHESRRERLIIDKNILFKSTVAALKKKLLLAGNKQNLIASYGLNILEILLFALFRALDEKIDTTHCSKDAVNLSWSWQQFVLSE